MARDLEQLVLDLDANLRRYERKLDQAQGKFDKTSRAIEKRQRELDKNLARLGEDLGRGFANASLVAGAAFAAISAYAIKAAADAAEIENAFNVAFGTMADEARSFARTFSDEVGRSFYETQESMSRARLVLDGFGFSGEQALDVVKQIQARSVDIGSLFNVKDADAFAAIISGLTGETEPMKRFGVVVNETAVKAELLRMGFKGSSTQASEQAKVLARLNLILRGTDKAQGDAAKTADSFANQQKRLQGQVRDSAVELGNNFLPIAEKVLAWANDALKAFNSLPDGVQTAGLALLGLAAASGPIAAVIARLAQLITMARNAQAALAGVGAAGAAGGTLAGAAGGRAAVAAGAGSAGVLGLFGLGAYSVLNARQARQVAQNPSQATDAELQAAIRSVENQLTAYVKTDPTARKDYSPGSIGGKYQEQLGALHQERMAREMRAARAADTGPLVPALPNGFSLSPEQLAGTGGGGRGRSGGADKARREAERLAEIALRQQERTDALLGRASEDLLRERQGLVLGAEERLAAELAAIALEREQRNAELDYAVKQGELTRAQADQVAAAEEAVRLQREVNASAEAVRAIAADQARVRQADLDGQIELAQLAAGLAETASERRAAELRVLELVEQRERAELEAVIAAQDVAEADKEIARRKLATLNAGAGMRREGVARDTAGPLEGYFDSLPDTVDKVNERMEALAADGISSVVDGLAGAAAGFNSLGDVARRVLADLAYQLTKLNLERMLANLSGGGGGGAGSLFRAGLSLLGGSFGGGGGGADPAVLAQLTGLFANGTNSAPGGLALVGEDGPEIVNVPRGAQVIPNDVLRKLANVQPAGRRGFAGPSTTFAPVFNTSFAGPVSAAEARRTGQQLGAAAMREMSRARRKGF